MKLILIIYVENIRSHALNFICRSAVNIQFPLRVNMSFYSNISLKYISCKQIKKQNKSICAFKSIKL